MTWPLLAHMLGALAVLVPGSIVVSAMVRDMPSADLLFLVHSTIGAALGAGAYWWNLPERQSDLPTIDFGTVLAAGMRLPFFAVPLFTLPVAALAPVPPPLPPIWYIICLVVGASQGVALTRRLKKSSHP